MPMYSYVAKDASGKTKKDIVEALGEQSLIDKLQNEGLFVVSVKPVLQRAAAPKPATPETPKQKINKSFTHNKVRIEDMLTLARQLATMLDSGVTLMRSLSVVADQIESRQLYEVVTAFKG